MIQRILRRVLLLLILAAIVAGAFRSRHGPRFRFPKAAPWATSRTLPVRPDGTRVPVDPAAVWVDDGDTIRITWPDGSREPVRILGIDAPEVRHKNDPMGEDQPGGPESLAFARSRILGARQLELVRASHRDRFGRTLGYLFLDGVNYSVLAIENHMAESTIDRFGDSGFPREAAEVREAAPGGAAAIRIPRAVPGSDGRCLESQLVRACRLPGSATHRSLLPLRPACRPDPHLTARCDRPRARDARSVRGPVPPDHRPAS